MSLDSLTTQLRESSAPLDQGEIESAVDMLLDNDIPVAARADFLEALQERGVNGEELAAFARALLARCLPLDHGLPACLDVCGTGGDRAGLFNVSTAVMFVAAGCGARVAKHGNRGITSKCGGADVLEALGVPIDLPPESAARALTRHGCAFLFAPAYHPAVKAVVPVRQALAARGIPTIFNLLGPLINPARPTHQLVGVYHPAALPLYASALGALGRNRAWAVHGTGAPGLALDEISTSGLTVIAEPGKEPWEIDMSDYGFRRANIEDLRGGDAARNAEILTGILDGSDHGPRRDIVVANTAAALTVCGIAENLADGIRRAAEALDSRRALDVLDSMRSFRP